MDGIHDLGGKQGFGRVVKDGRTAGFHDAWEIKINAITGKLVGHHVYNMDEYRHAIERMLPRRYVSASYFERVYVAVTTLCVEKGLLTREELNAATGEPVALSQPSLPGRTQSEALPDLQVGDQVRVRDMFVGGHIRMPAYVRGKTGRIVGVSPEYPFPDAAGHGLASPKQRTFDVSFNSRDLWGDAADDAEVHVGLFHAYLEKVE